MKRTNEQRLLNNAHVEAEKQNMEIFSKSVIKHAWRGVSLDDQDFEANDSNCTRYKAHISSPAR